MKQMLINPNLSEFEALLAAEPLVLLFVSNSACSTCVADAARVDTYQDQLPVVKIEISQAPEVPAQNMILSAPTVLLFYQGKEVARESGFIDFRRLENHLQSFSDYNKEG